jgi:hypothetical protein
MQGNVTRYNVQGSMLGNMFSIGSRRLQGLGWIL